MTEFQKNLSAVILTAGVMAALLSAEWTLAAGPDGLGVTSPAPALTPNPATNTVATGDSTNVAATVTNRLATLRDPFWPVGYEKPKPKKKKKKKVEEVVEKVKVPDTWPKLNVKGFTKVGSEYMAIVDQIGIVQTGDIIKLKSAGFIYRWKVVRVLPRGLSVKRLDAAPSGEPRKRVRFTPKTQPVGDGLQ